MLFQLGITATSAMSHTQGGDLRIRKQQMMAALKIKAVFADISALRHAVRFATVEGEFELHVINSDKRSCTVQCRKHTEGCSYC